MKLSIIPIDKTVCEDGICYANLTWDGTPINIHALQWQDISGWVEFNDGTPNEDITVLPNWAINAMSAWQIAYDEANKPPSPPTAEENKQTASYKLQTSDWTTIADVGNPQFSNPYLSNQSEFVSYRNAIRQIAVYPVAGNIDWAIEPKAVWIKT